MERGRHAADRIPHPVPHEAHGHRRVAHRNRGRKREEPEPDGIDVRDDVPGPGAAENAGGNSAYAPTTPAEAVAPLILSRPGAPTSFTVGPSTTAHAVVRLAWGAPSTGGAVASYQYAERRAGGSWSGYRTISGGASTRSLSLTKTQNALWSFRLRAQNAAGFSPVVTASGRASDLRPPQPTGLTATASTTVGGRLTWRWDVAAGATGYQWRYRRTAPHGGRMDRMVGCQYHPSGGEAAERRRDLSVSGAGVNAHGSARRCR